MAASPDQWKLGSHDPQFSSAARLLEGAFVIPLGAAFAQKYAGTDDISIAVIGDGSFDEGILYEAMNFGGSLSTAAAYSVREQQILAANTEIAKTPRPPPSYCPKPKRWGYRARSSTAMIWTTYFDRLVAAIALVRSRKKGPRYMEVMTYRYCAHVGPLPDDYLGYRSSDEIAAWQAKDSAFFACRAALIMNPGILDQVTKIEAEIEDEIAASIEAAKAAPFPALDWAIGINCANTYAPRRGGVFFANYNQVFQGGQNETKLEPF